MSDPVTIVLPCKHCGGGWVGVWLSLHTLYHLLAFRHLWNPHAVSPFWVCLNRLFLPPGTFSTRTVNDMFEGEWGVFVFQLGDVKTGVDTPETKPATAHTYSSCSVQDFSPITPGRGHNSVATQLLWHIMTAGYSLTTAKPCTLHTLPGIS